MQWLMVLAQEAPGGLPDDVGSGIIWGAVLAVIVALYILVRNSRRKADDQETRILVEYLQKSLRERGGK